MSDTPNRDLDDTPPALPEGEVESGRPSPSVSRWMVRGLAGVAVIIVLLFLVAIVGGISDSAGVANFFRILRDLFIIILALQGIVICLALVILISQVSALISLLSTEVKPIVEEARETVMTARGTAEFVSKNVTSPVIRVASTAAGVRTFLVELLGIRRNITGRARR